MIKSEHVEQVERDIEEASLELHIFSYMDFLNSIKSLAEEKITQLRKELEDPQLSRLFCPECSSINPTYERVDNHWFVDCDECGHASAYIPTSFQANEALELVEACRLWKENRDRLKKQ